MSNPDPFTALEWLTIAAIVAAAVIVIAVMNAEL